MNVVYLFLAQHDPQPGQPERLVLEYPGERAEALAYVTQHWPGLWTCPDVPQGRVMVLCQQVRAGAPPPVAEEPAGESEVDETLFSDDLAGEDQWGE